MHGATIRFIFQNNSRSDRNESDIVINVHKTSCNVYVIHTILQENMKYLYKVSEYVLMSNFVELFLLGAEFFHEERRTDRHNEVNNLFSQCCKSAQKHLFFF